METEHGSASEAPADERAGQQIGRTYLTAPHLDSTGIPKKQLLRSFREGITWWFPRWENHDWKQDDAVDYIMKIGLFDYADNDSGNKELAKDYIKNTHFNNAQTYEASTGGVSPAHLKCSGNAVTGDTKPADLLDDK